MFESIFESYFVYIWTAGTVKYWMICELPSCEIYMMGQLVTQVKIFWHFLSPMGGKRGCNTTKLILKVTFLTCNNFFFD